MGKKFNHFLTAVSAAAVLAMAAPAAGQDKIQDNIILNCWRAQFGPAGSDVACSYDGDVIYYRRMEKAPAIEVTCLYTDDQKLHPVISNNGMVETDFVCVRAGESWLVVLPKNDPRSQTPAVAEGEDHNVSGPIKAIWQKSSLEDGFKKYSTKETSSGYYIEARPCQGASCDQLPWWQEVANWLIDHSWLAGLFGLFGLLGLKKRGAQIG